MSKASNPSDRHAEIAVLAGLMLDSSTMSDINSKISPDMFTSPERNDLFRAFTMLHEEKKPIDVVCVVDKLHEMGINLERFGGHSGLIEMIEGIPSTANLPHYAGIVRRNFYYRQIIDMSSEVGSAALHGGSELFDVIGKAVELYKEYVTKSTTLNLSLQEVLRIATERVSNKSGLIPLGFKRFDEQMGGILRREPTVIAARTSSLKTTLCTDRTNFWLDQGLRVQAMSLEVPADMWIRKILCNRGNIDGLAMRRFALTETQMATFLETCNSMYTDFDGKLSVLGPSEGVKNPQILEQAAREFKPDVLIVDYIGLMPTSKQHKRLDLEEHMIFLKELCIDLDAALVIVAQISRSPLKRTSGPLHPRLDDIKESGGIEENASDVLLLYYHYTVTKSIEDAHRVRVELAKSKYGPCTVHHLFVQPRYSRLTDLGFERFDDHGRQITRTEATQGDSF